ncbi:MAG: recombinase family protein [Fusobacterium ulcerans]|nr:recombinase family protein [Fusobacterium ulcerans]MEE0139122.1 recombinase family protein [Fusobacterium ulcerans]
MRKIEYVRVSSEDQNLDKQFHQLNEIEMNLIFQEKISVATTNRKKLQDMFSKLKEKYTICITDLTRSI